MHPLDYQILRKVENMSQEQKRRVLELIDLAFQDIPNTSAE